MLGGRLKRFRRKVEGTRQTAFEVAELLQPSVFSLKAYIGKAKRSPCREAICLKTVMVPTH